MSEFVCESVVKNPPAKAGDSVSIPGWERFLWRRKWQPTPEFFPGKSNGHRSLARYSPWGRKRVRYDLATNKQQTISQSFNFLMFCRKF